MFPFGPDLVASDKAMSLDVRMYEVARRLAIVLGLGATLAGLTVVYSGIGTAGGATGSGSGVGASSARWDSTPRFSLSTTEATWDNQVVLRVEKGAVTPRQEVRLYLAPTGIARSMRSRFNARLSFIGTVQAKRHARLVFTVPPLDAGSYELAFWCRKCLSNPPAIEVQPAARLIVTAPAGESCPATEPNERGPRGPQGGPGLRWHGNGELGAFLRSDGNLVTNALGGYKLLWAGKEGLDGKMVVRYRKLYPPSEWLTTLRTGWFREGYRVWPSQMDFTPGCWQIVGRIRDVSLSFVVSVVLGTS